jgi:hypothetical protein
VTNFLPPPVTPSERNRSPRAACKSFANAGWNQAGLAANENEILFTAARDAVGEEPIGMGGW